MEEAAADLVLGVAVIFARVGGVFLIAPGLSSMRIPVQAKLFLALGIALALTPTLLPEASAAIAARTPATILSVLFMESAIGLMLGLLARLLLMALQTMAVATANAIGLGGIPGFAMDGEPEQAAATLFMVTAVTIIFLTDLHHELLRGLVGSYTVLAPGDLLSPQDALVAVTDRISDAFFVALRLVAPFMIYSVIVNFAVGLTNKLSPQLPVFFVALPFITAGGLYMLAIAIREVMIAFADAFDQFMVGL